MIQPYLEWHTKDCEDRHGVLRHVPPGSVPDVDQALFQLYGPRSAWRLWNEGGGDYDMEFINGAAFYPRPKKPWGVCGTSILFEDAHQEELAASEAAQEFNVGDEVRFAHGGEWQQGLIARVNATRCTVVVKDHDRPYYVYGKELTKT